MGYIYKNEIKIYIEEILKFYVYKHIIIIKNNKIKIKAYIYLIQKNLIDIFNYYSNISLQIYYYYYYYYNNDIVNLLYILKKACFLTMRLKLLKNNKILTYRKFNILFNFIIMKKTKKKIRKQNLYSVKISKIKKLLK
jgi:hypothetical protein